MTHTALTYHRTLGVNSPGRGHKSRDPGLERKPGANWASLPAFFFSRTYDVTPAASI